MNHQMLGRFFTPPLKSSLGNQRLSIFQLISGPWESFYIIQCLLNILSKVRRIQTYS
ncbi:unnamed protein product [Paramecium octaurelia]|uniref:Uncharacterized protein n=1 Tax=Paramecium octaurelia TaxID=43137 RepID=A0A8S1XFM4_PAROT|nr:unnamed protein product [Paramecium octaurelia]